MMEWIKNHRNMVLAALGVLMVLLPVVVHSSYLLGILIRILLYTMLAGSLNMINGYSGQMNLGHAGLYCIGSYTAGILAVKYQVGFLPLLFISGFVTALFGFLVSLPTIKLAGVYLAIVTIGFSEITRLVALNWTGLTGGPMGIKGIPRPGDFRPQALRTGTFLLPGPGAGGSGAVYDAPGGELPHRPGMDRHPGGSGCGFLSGGEYQAV